MPYEGQSANVIIRVGSTIALGAFRRNQQSDLFVIADSRNLHAAFLGGFANRYRAHRIHLLILQRLENVSLDVLISTRYGSSMGRSRLKRGRRKLWRLRYRATAALALVAFGPSGAAAYETGTDPSKIRVEHAEILVEAPDRSTAAAYITLFNNSASQLNLLDLNGDFFTSASLHIQELGSERHIDPGMLTIPPRAELTMRPGGVHVRLEELQRRLRPGDRVPLSLVFEGGVSISVDAIVLPYKSAPTHHDHGERDGHGQG